MSSELVGGNVPPAFSLFIFGGYIICYSATRRQKFSRRAAETALRKNLVDANRPRSIATHLKPIDARPLSFFY